MNKKKFLTFGIIGFFAMALVSGALLTYFGVITTIADVKQSVTVMGSETHKIPEIAPGGEEFCYLHKLKNDASIDIDLKFPITCTRNGGADDCGGITEKIYSVPETTTLHLESKDSTWQPDARMTADLTFDTVNPTFNYTLKATGLTDGIDYVLIYYADKPKRFQYWGGDNPGKVIDTFTGAQANAGFSNGVEINMNLPMLPDWNINPSPDYCNNNNGFDSYVHCKGAKLWIVPVSDLTSGDLPVTWNPSHYLYETDLIVYSDCDLEPENFVVDMVKDGEVTQPLNTQSHTITPILVCYDFDLMIAPGNYVIETKVIA